MTSHSSARRCAAALLSVSLLATSVAPLAQTARRAEPVTLNFVNADIEGVTRAMAAILNQQFIVDPRVKGTITLYSEQPLAPRDAYLNFLAALRGLGFTVVEANGIYKVVPEADAKLQSGTVAIGETNRRGDQVLTQIFRLVHENANNLVPVLRPLISPNNTINANPGNNTLVITDYADNLQRIARIITAMDTPAAGDVEVLTLQNAVAGDVAALVQRVNETAAAGAVPGVAGATGASILVDARSNSLLVRAPNPARMAAIRSLVSKLDQPLQGQAATGNIWVVHLKNADAVKLATVLRAAFTGGGGSGGGGGGGGQTSSNSGLGGNAAGSALGNANNAGGIGGTSTQATTPVSASASPSTGGFVQADPATNSLIITAPEPLYRQIRSMIDQLDSRRAQVYIESMIVEVSGDNNAAAGFQWQGVIGKQGDNTGVVLGTNSTVAGPSIISLATAIAGGGTTSTDGTTSAGGVTGLSSGLNIGLVRNFGGAYNLAAIANFLQGQASTNITSTPNLITLDNEEAKIVVGQNVPFITGQYTNTGNATTSPFQTIERKDVGITLRIKPQIGENGTVKMVIYQESSSIASTTGSAGPTTNKRSIESTVVVEDGSIIVLGGLIADNYTSNQEKVPLLGDIPYVGALFRSETRNKTRSNLMVFLRPMVMRDAAATDKLSLDRYDLIRAIQKDAQPAKTLLLPINETPVLPPSSRVDQSAVPLNPPPTPSKPTTTAPSTTPSSN